MRRICLFAALAAALLGAAEPADNWPQWRGPNLNGSSTTARNLPIQWGAKTNIRWRTALPSWSAATPIVWGDTVFVASAEQGFHRPTSYRHGAKPARHGAGEQTHDNRKIFLIALNRSDGAERWRREIGDGNRIYRKQNLSSPSPITDGRLVWTTTGNGRLSAFDFAGNLIWKREIQADYGRFGLSHGYASSPLLHGRRLYIQVLHGMKTDGPSYVFAVDKRSGKTVWKVDRPTDADAESADNYSTPVLVTVEGKRQLVVSGGDYVTGHDLTTGRELWRMGGFNPHHERYYRTIASSLVIGDVVYTTSTRGKPFIAFRAGGRGNITGKAELWKNDGGSDVPTPATDGRLIYVVNDRGVATAYDRASGKPVWGPHRLTPGTYSASPLIADGKLYAVNEEGTTTVLRAGGRFEILSVNRLDSHTLASPAAAGDQLFIRTADYLYCIRKNAD